MTVDPPVVSIAIRAYRRRWLGDAVASVLTQTHRDLELVVYDDAGDLESVAAGFGDARIRYCPASRRLQASGRFLAAVALCRGRFIGVLDDDDRYEPDFLARLLEALHQDSSAGVAFCRTTWDWSGRTVVPADGRLPGRQAHAAAEMLTKGWTVSPSHMLIRRAAFDEAMRDQPMPDGVAPDVFLNVRIAMAGWHLVLVDAPLAVCRWHDDQISRSTPAASDVAVATWSMLDLQDPALAAMRDRRLARALIVRAMERVRRGDMDRAEDDLRTAAQICPSGWSTVRRLLSLAVRMGPSGRLATEAWATCSLRGRRRQEPPRAIGDRGLPWTGR